MIYTIIGGVLTLAIFGVSAWGVNIMWTLPTTYVSASEYKDDKLELKNELTKINERLLRIMIHSGVPRKPDDK